jgi:hypothetical protein
MWPATSPGPFFGVAAFAVVAGGDVAGADVAGADVAELASTGVFAESAMAAAVVDDVETCATELGADEMVNDGWVAP